MCYFKFSQLQSNDGVKWYLENPNINVFILFTVKITASHLTKIRYSPYQKELWKMIKEKHDTGMGYRRISHWLNEHGYKTPRGREFKHTYVFSILKKKRIADERMRKRYQPVIRNMRIRVSKINLSEPFMKIKD